MTRAPAPAYLPPIQRKRASETVFGLGLIEIAIVLILGYLAFKKMIVRKFPTFSRSFDFVFYATMALMILFGVISRFR